MTQVYGKASYQKGRTTVKDPYLHFQNTAKPKPTRPAAVKEVKGQGKLLIIYLTLYPIDTHFYASTTDSFLKTLWDKKKLLETSNFFFSHNVFYSIRKLYPHLSIFLTLYLYLLLNWKSPKLAYQVKESKQLVYFTHCIHLTHYQTTKF